MKHLWEYDHPYHMHDEYGEYQHFLCFDDFLLSWHHADIDLNRIHRWDFELNEESGKPQRLNIYYIMQRKGRTLTCHINIIENDEERIKAFLKPHAELNRKLWEGV